MAYLYVPGLEAWNSASVPPVPDSASSVTLRGKPPLPRVTHGTHHSSGVHAGCPRVGEACASSPLAAHRRAVRRRHRGGRADRGGRNCRQARCSEQSGRIHSRSYARRCSGGSQKRMLHAVRSELASRARFGMAQAHYLHAQIRAGNVSARRRLENYW